MANENACCLCSCPEKCTLIYGFISCIITLLGALASIGLLIYVVIDSFAEHPVVYVDGTKFYLYVGILVILAILCMIAFTFCVFLIKGIRQKNAEYVKAYFVFGVIEILLLIIGSAIYRALTVDQAEIFVGVFALYGLPLIFVWKTYKMYLPSPAYEKCDRA